MLESFPSMIEAWVPAASSYARSMDGLFTLIFISVGIAFAVRGEPMPDAAAQRFAGLIHAVLAAVVTWIGYKVKEKQDEEKPNNEESDDER